MKSARVYSSIVRLVVHFIVNLEESIYGRAREYRKIFLAKVLKDIQNIVAKAEFNDRIKLELEAYMHLIVELLSETEKDGLSSLRPHFETLDGDVLTLRL